MARHFKNSNSRSPHSESSFWHGNGQNSSGSSFGGSNKVAQKVGEEAVELVIEAKDDNDDLFLNESADLLFHLLILLRAKGFQLNDVVKVLESWH